MQTTPMKMQRDARGRFVKAVRTTAPVQSALRIDARANLQTVFVPKKQRKANGPVIIIKG